MTKQKARANPRATFKLSAQNYQYLFENASDAMWVHDIKGSILVANKACEKLTGYSREELTGMNVVDFLTPEHLGVAREVKQRLLEGKPIPERYEQKLLKKDGTIAIVKMSTSPLVVDGPIAGFQNIARDITEEKQMQENLRFYVQQITQAQEEERKRLARQLHDDVAPPMLLLIQSLDSVASGRPKLAESTVEKLEALRNEAIGALEAVRRCAKDLRPPILDDLGLTAALEWMADDLQRTYGIDTHVQSTLRDADLTTNAQLLLFRIAQEALSNIRKHSEASVALVKLEATKNKIKMTVADNGKGFHPPPVTPTAWLNPANWASPVCTRERDSSGAPAPSSPRWVKAPK